MFTAAKVVVLFSSGMTPKARLRSYFRRFGIEGNDLFGVAFLQMGLARSMTLLATRDLVFPAREVNYLRMSRVGKVLELVLMAIFAGFAANIVPRLVGRF